MNEEQIRIIIRDELSDLMKSDRYTITRTLQILNGRNIIVGTSDGTKFSTETSQKIAFHGTTPSIQQAKISDPSGGVTQDTQARTAINSIIDVLENKGFTSAS